MKMTSLLRVCLLVVFAYVGRSVSSEPVMIKLNVHQKSETGIDPNSQQLAVGKSAQAILRNVQNLYYTGVVQVGTPAKDFKVVFDTGSTDMWLGSSSLCTNQAYCKTHFTYNHKSSTSYKKDGREFFLSYLVGSIQGTVVSDTVSVSGLKVPGQLFGEATTLDAQSLASQYDGIVGLGFTLNSVFPADPLFVNMINKKIVASPVFGFYLSKTSSPAAVLTLGGVDSSHFTGQFTFAPVSSRFQWTIKLDSILRNRNKVVGQFDALPDSGAEKILGPPSIIDVINSGIGKTDKNGQVPLDCNKLSGLPAVTFVISKKAFIMRPNDYVKKTVNAKGEVSCSSGFESSVALDYVILGDSFMRKFYTQFDMGENPRVGFAMAK